MFLLINKKIQHVTPVTASLILYFLQVRGREECLIGSTGLSFNNVLPSGLSSKF